MKTASHWSFRRVAANPNLIGIVRTLVSPGSRRLSIRVAYVRLCPVMDVKKLKTVPVVLLLPDFPGPIGSNRELPGPKKCENRPFEILPRQKPISDLWQANKNISIAKGRDVRKGWQHYA